MTKQEQIENCLQRFAIEFASILGNIPDSRAPDRLLNTTQLAEFASLSSTTITQIIREMEAAGTGGVIRRGRAVRVSRNAFMDYMEGRRTRWRK